MLDWLRHIVGETLISGVGPVHCSEHVPPDPTDSDRQVVYTHGERQGNTPEFEWYCCSSCRQQVYTFRHFLRTPAHVCPARHPAECAERMPHPTHRCPKIDRRIGLCHRCGVVNVKWFLRPSGAYRHYCPSTRQYHDWVPVSRSPCSKCGKVPESESRLHACLIPRSAALHDYVDLDIDTMAIARKWQEDNLMAWPMNFVTSKPPLTDWYDRIWSYGTTESSRRAAKSINYAQLYGGDGASYAKQLLRKDTTLNNDHEAAVNNRMAKARKLKRAGAITFIGERLGKSEFAVRGDSQTYIVTVEGAYAPVSTGRPKFNGTCTCTDVKFNKPLTNGFCKHIVTVGLTLGYSEETLRTLMRPPTPRPFTLGVNATNAGEGPTYFKAINDKYEEVVVEVSNGTRTVNIKTDAEGTIFVSYTTKDGTPYPLVHLKQDKDKD